MYGTKKGDAIHEHEGFNSSNKTALRQMSLQAGSGTDFGESLPSVQG